MRYKTNVNIGKMLLFALNLFLFFPACASALVIDFEDAGTGSLKGTGYASLHWEGAYVEKSSGMLSGQVVQGEKMTIYSGPFRDFNICSMDVASETTNTIFIEAYRFGDKVFKEEIQLDALEESLLDLDLLSITRLDIWSEGNSTFLLDNLKINWLCGGGKECGTMGNGPAGTPSGNPNSSPPGGGGGLHNPNPGGWSGGNGGGSHNPNPGGSGGGNGGGPGGGYNPPPKCPPPCPPPQPPPAPVPEPSTLLLLGSGMAIMMRLLRKSDRS